MFTEYEASRLLTIAADEKNNHMQGKLSALLAKDKESSEELTFLESEAIRLQQELEVVMTKISQTRSGRIGLEKDLDQASVAAQVCFVYVYMCVYVYVCVIYV